MQPFVVRAPRVFDGDRFLAGGGWVLVDKGRLVALGAGDTAPPSGVPILDRPGATLLPGLIDTHVHLIAGAEPDALALDPARTDEEREDVIRRSLLGQVAAGVTTVRDLGDNRFCVVDRGVGDDEPMVVGCGPPITSPGGHCAALGGEVAGERALREAVARRHERGVQVIKVIVSGGAMTAGSDLLALQFGADDVRAVVEEAHLRGLPVTAHAHSVASVRVCLAAGVDEIEHCTCLTEHGIDTPADIVDGLARTRTRVCPTFGRLPDLPPSPQAVDVMRRTGMTLEARFAQVGQLYAAGVPIVAGSDAGIHPAKPHGVLPWSVAELVGSGLPLQAALAAATSGAARACGLETVTGRLQSGLGADLLVVDGDLAADVLALTRVSTVVVRGRVVSGALHPGGADHRPLRLSTGPG